MAYSTGTATDASDLLQKLVTWLTTSRGWTADTSVAAGSGWRATLHKGSQYVTLRAAAAAENVSPPFGNAATTARGIYLYGHTSYSAGAGIFAQPGFPVGYLQTYAETCGMQLGVSGYIVSYDFFDDGSDNIVVVAQKAAGVFGYLCFGPSLTKAGTWTGGAYTIGSNAGYYTQHSLAGTPSYDNTSSSCPTCPAALGSSETTGYVRADIDAFTGNWASVCYPSTEGGTLTANTQNWTGKTVLGWAPSSVTPTSINSVPGIQYEYGAYRNQLSSIPMLLPCRLFAVRDSGGCSVLGDLPNVFFSEAVGNGYSARDTVSIGADTYMLFPNFAVKKV